MEHKPSRYTAFITPGTFDLHSIDTFGMNAKPNSINPIGYFGTGLKYAIAVLLRNGAKLTLYCNDDEYTFFLRDEDFRGSTFRRVCYEKVNKFLGIFGTPKELSYTTELGKNWELWQAFRELYANTLDEHGIVINQDKPVVHPSEREGHTCILIDHFDFALLVGKKDEIFLNPQRELKIDTESGNIAEQKSKHLYYRGMRALDLPEDQEAMFTYNIIDPLELTEDRTIKSTYEVKGAIETLIERSTDKDFIRAVLTAPEKTFEANLGFEYAYGSSQEFKETVIELKRSNTRINSSADRYYSARLAPPPSPNKIDDKLWHRIVKCLTTAKVNLEDFSVDLLPEVDPIYEVFAKAFREEFERA